VSRISMQSSSDRAVWPSWLHSSAAGMTVAIIERQKFAGTCVNTECIPTKTLVASAYATHLARRGAEFRFVVNG
jgi:pyruvate/2-oxoglutarate dehydrogenase complex dihydrolipoamide dehydrogenase (E3) component